MSARANDGALARCESLASAGTSLLKVRADSLVCTQTFVANFKSDSSKLSLGSHRLSSRKETEGLLIFRKNLPNKYLTLHPTCISWIVMKTFSPDAFRSPGRDAVGGGMWHVQPSLRFSSLCVSFIPGSLSRNYFLIPELCYKLYV